MSLAVENNNRPDSPKMMEICDVNGSVDEPMPMIENVEIHTKSVMPFLKCDLEETTKIPVNTNVEDATKTDSPASDTDDITVLAVITPPVPPVTDYDIRRLQSDLLLEESRLILMKKMLQLQTAPPKQEKRDDVVVIGGKTGAVAPSRNSAANGPVQQNGLRNVKGSLAAARSDRASVRDPKMQTMIKSGVPSNYPRSNIGPAVLELSKSLAHKQSLNVAKSQQMSSHPVAQNNTVRGAVASQHTPKLQQAHPLERLEQQLLEDKVTLKRQMEKAILQIVPPKAPFPDMNFIPATVCPDFIALLGMELAASYAITSKNLVDQSPYPEPFVCLSCQENVCPAWKVDGETGGVVCESCFAASRTNAARLSHIENLKVAFADVVEKEAEQDRRHAATLAKAKASHHLENIAPTAAAAPSVFASQKSTLQQQLKHQVPANNYHPSNNSAHLLTRPSNRVQQQHPPPHHMNSSPMHHHYQQRTSLPPAPQSRHTGKPTITNPYQQLAAPLPFAPTSSSSVNKQLAYHGGSGQASRQTAERQYLLDMISRPQKLHQQQQQHQSTAWRK